MIGASLSGIDMWCPWNGLTKQVLEISGQLLGIPGSFIPIFESTITGQKSKCFCHTACLEWSIKAATWELHSTHSRL